MINVGLVDVSIVLSRIRHSQASQVGSFRQILARILRSDGSVLAWIINKFDTCNAFSASENEIQQIKKAVKQSRGGLDHLVQVLRPENVILIDCAAVLRTQHLVGAT